MMEHTRILFPLMDNLIILVESVLFFLFADLFLYRRWKGAAPMLPGVAANWAAQLLIAALGAGQIKIVLSLGLDALLLILYYQENRRPGHLLKKAFLLTGFYLFMAGAQALSIAVLYPRLGGGAGADLHANPSLAWGAYVVSLLLVMLCLHICRRFRRVETVPLTTGNWLALLAAPTAGISFVWLCFPLGRGSVDGDVLLLMAGLSAALLCGNLFVFWLYRSMAAAAAALHQREELERYCGHLSALLRSEGMRRNAIHDYLHNLGVIAALIESGRAGDAATFIYRLERRIKKIHAVRHTGNREIDAILSSKLPLMREQGISCSVDGVLPPTLPFDFLDVCALLSNALDNALAACVRQELAGELIALRVNFQNGFLKLELSNPIGGEAAARFHHVHEGRGLPIMRRVAEKYDGILTVSIADGRYILSALLQQPPH